MKNLETIIDKTNESNDCDNRRIKAKSDDKNKNIYSYIEQLDLRPIIKSVAACENIHEIKFIDTLIFPKNRDAETMSAISGIKLSFIDEIIYLDDDEPLNINKGLEYKNSAQIELFEKDFTSKRIECKNCAIVAIHAISDTTKEFPPIEFKNVATLVLDNSLKKCFNKLELKNVASTHYCSLPEDANIKVYNHEKIDINKTMLEQWGQSAIIICHNSKIIFDNALSFDELSSYNILFILNSTKIKINNKLKIYILSKAICNNVKYKRN